MVKITRLEHLEQVPEKKIVPYIAKILESFLEEYKDYCPNGSIETIGAIFFIISKEDLTNHSAFGLLNPLEESHIEWKTNIGNEFVNICVVLDNDRAINIIGKEEYFEEIQGERNENTCYRTYESPQS